MTTWHWHFFTWLDEMPRLAFNPFTLALAPAPSSLGLVMFNTHQHTLPESVESRLSCTVTTSRLLLPQISSSPLSFYCLGRKRLRTATTLQFSPPDSSSISYWIISMSLSDAELQWRSRVLGTPTEFRKCVRVSSIFRPASGKPHLPRTFAANLI